MTRFRVELAGRMSCRGLPPDRDVVDGLVIALPEALARLGRLETTVWLPEDDEDVVDVELPDVLVVRLVVASDSDFEAEKRATERVRLAVRSLVHVDPPLSLGWDGAYIEALPKSA